MKARLVAVLAFFVSLFSTAAMATDPTGLDLSAVSASITANQAVLVGLGVVILTLVYAVRAISWARKV